MWRECKVPAAPTALTPVLGPDAGLDVGEVVLPWNTLGLTARDTVVVEWRHSSQSAWTSTSAIATDVAAMLRLPRAGVWKWRLSVVDGYGQRGPVGAEQTLTLVLPTPAGLAGSWSDDTARLVWDLTLSTFPLLAVVETNYGTTNWYGLGTSVGSSFSAPQPPSRSWGYRISYDGISFLTITITS